MKKSKKLNPFILLVAAAVLLLASTVGSARAALTYYSENYVAGVTISNIGIKLMENGKEISRRNYIEEDEWDETRGYLFTGHFPTEDSLVLGKKYPEALAVNNGGTIDTYVKAIVKKSWKDAEGVKNTALSPELIDLHFVTGSNGWVIDEEASTAERTVLYYTEILPAGVTTPAFTDTLRIDPAVASKMTETVEVEVKDGKEYKTIRYEYEYDGYIFDVEVEADAVQTHNAVDAIKSAWGIDVILNSDGSISLK